jgi:hypothetical protein
MLTRPLTNVFAQPRQLAGHFFELILVSLQLFGLNMS